MLIEFPDPAVRAERLRHLKGVERAVVLVIDGVRIEPVADEDLERENEEKTSAVHFMRYQIPEALRAGFSAAAVTMTVDHPAYRHSVTLSDEARAALGRDLAD
jgi:hypothetical protein